MNMGVDTLSSYIILVCTLAGLTNKAVMMPETYEENPLKNQGKLLAQAIIDER